MTPAAIERVFGSARLRMVTGDHVEVFREAARTGERRRYTKRFLATPAADFRQWTEREWRILARLVGHGIACVPDVVRFDRGDAGAPALIQTYDAGVTVDHWATLLPVRRPHDDGAAAGPVLRHVFEDGAHWWALARHALAALDAIHALGLVHLDLKADNVCIPVGPADFDPHRGDARLQPRFGELALIDFAFSLVSGEPLPSALPIARQNEFDYQSPRLLRALEAGSRGDLLPTRQLDWRCDFFSLAAMLDRYLPEDAIAATGPTGHWRVEHLDAAHALVQRLRQIHDSGRPAERPHAALIGAADALLEDAELAAALRRGFTFAADHAGAGAESPTPVTRVAPPVEPPRVDADPIVIDADDALAMRLARLAPRGDAASARRRRSAFAVVAALAAVGAAAGSAWWAWRDAEDERAARVVAAAVAERRVAAPAIRERRVAAAPAAELQLPPSPAPAVVAAAIAAPSASVEEAAAASDPAPLPQAPVVAPQVATVSPATAKKEPARTPPHDPARGRPKTTKPPAVVAFPARALRSAKAAPQRTPVLAVLAPRGAPAARPGAKPRPAAPASTHVVATARQELIAPPTVVAAAPARARAAEPAPAPAPVDVAAPRLDFTRRAQVLLAEQIPRSAQRAERLVLRVLFAAANADDDGDEDVRRAARSIRLAPADPQLAGGSDAAEARALQETARAAWRRGQAHEALAWQTRAFGANPLDAEIAGSLAFYKLRQHPADPEAARQLALHALTLHDWKHPHGRLDDWTTLAIASALAGRERESRNAWLATIALGGASDRQCRAAINAYAAYGERLRAPVEALLQRAHAAGRGEASPLCEWPPHWATAQAQR